MSAVTRLLIANGEYPSHVAATCSHVLWFAAAGWVWLAPYRSEVILEPGSSVLWQGRRLQIHDRDEPTALGCLLVAMSGPVSESDLAGYLDSGCRVVVRAGERESVPVVDGVEVMDLAAGQWRTMTANDIDPRSALL